MDNAVEIMSELTEAMRGLSQTKRVEQLERVKRIAALLGLDPRNYDYFAYNVARWPDRLNRHATEIRFGVDFAYGEQPDHRLYGATFDEVAKLLRYTPESCRVAFNTSKNNKIDRTTRRTRLGPCVVTKLPDVINPADYPTMRRLADREAELFPTPQADVAGRVKRHRGNKY